jgi:hypothetical protein
MSSKNQPERLIEYWKPRRRSEIKARNGVETRTWIQILRQTLTVTLAATQIQTQTPAQIQTLPAPNPGPAALIAMVTLPRKVHELTSGVGEGEMMIIKCI